MASDDLAAAITVAQVNASAQYASAALMAKAQVDAATAGATLGGQFQVNIAQIEAGWRNSGNQVQSEIAQTQADAVTTSAETDANARRDVANTQAQATTQAATTEGTSRTESARAQADATVNAANADANSRIQAAAQQAAATIAAAASAANAETQAATTRAQAEVQVATISTANQTAVAQIEAASRTQSATIAGTFQVQTANVEGGWHITVAGIEAGANKYGSDKQYDASANHEVQETARLNLKLDFANDKFALLQPLLDQIINSGTGFLDGLDGGGTPAFRVRSPAPEASSGPLGFPAGPRARHGMATVGVGDVRGYASTLRMGDLDPPQDSGQGAGGSSTATNVTINAPYIATRGVFTPAMLQQQVNQAYARNDSRTQALIRKSQGDLAGRGFSSNSPILEALKVGYITANLRASIEAASQIRLQSAQANVDAVFRGQQARSEQYLAQEGVLVEAEKNSITRQVGVLNAIASLVGGVL